MWVRIPPRAPNIAVIFPVFLIFFRLIDTDPVDGHSLGEGCVHIRLAGPFASDSDVDQEVEFLMKGSTFLVGDGGTGIGGTVNEPLDLIFVPDDFKEVEVVSEGAVGELVLGWGEHGVFMFLVGVMDIGFDDSVVIRAVEFKDVNFAAAGPRSVSSVFIAVGT